MGNVLRSKDDQIELAQTHGMWNQPFYFRVTSAGTAATIDRGGLTMQRMPVTFTVPPVDTGVGLTGWYCTRAAVYNNTQTIGFYVGIETFLGSLNMSTGTFTDGDAMPTRTIKGASVQTAAQIVVMQCSGSVTATAPTITLTYTDQAGNTGNSAAITTGNSPANDTTYMFNKHLASADLGLVDVTNATKSAGTSGTISFYGLRVIADMPSNAYPGGYAPGRLGEVPWIAEPGEKIAIYTQGVTNGAMFGHIAMVADN